MLLSSTLFVLLLPDTEVRPVPHGLGKAPSMLMHPDGGLELPVCLQAVAVRSCWSASLLHQSWGADSPYDCQ
jgi:hypothetical protein